MIITQSTNCTEKTFLQDFLVILSQMHEMWMRIMNKFVWSYSSQSPVFKRHENRVKKNVKRWLFRGKSKTDFHWLTNTRDPWRSYDDVTVTLTSYTCCLNSRKEEHGIIFPYDKRLYVKWKEALVLSSCITSTPCTRA